MSLPPAPPTPPARSAAASPTSGSPGAAWVRAPGRERLRDWARAFWPMAQAVDGRERWRAVGGAVLGVFFTALLCQGLSGPLALQPWLVAPLGASAVLVFGVPASPLAQPWAVIGGNTVSALVGVACVRLVPDVALASALAVGLALALMFRLRCLHPPGGAAALLAVLTHATQFKFAGAPVMLNSCLLVLAGVAYNGVTGRRYPHRQLPAAVAPTAAAGAAAPRFTAADLDAAMAHYNQVLDVSRDDLQALLQEAEAQAYQRTLGRLSCGDIMTPEPVCVDFGTSLQAAWRLMREQRVKALPVVDRAHRIAGIITVADFMRHADLDAHEGLGQRLRDFVRPSGQTHSERPEVVGQVMTRQVRVTREDRLATDLMTLFSEGGHHHIPVLDSDNRLVGMITQSDLVRALHRAVMAPAA